MNGVLHCAPKSLHWTSQLLQHRGQEETSLELRHLIFFMDMEKEKALLSNGVALQGDVIYLDGDLTPTHVAHCKDNMPLVLHARINGKWAVYRDGGVTIMKRTT